jgi:hypothetical protein
MTRSSCSAACVPISATAVMNRRRILVALFPRDARV